MADRLLESRDYHEIVNLLLIELVVRIATNQLDINRREFWGTNVRRPTGVQTSAAAYRSRAEVKELGAGKRQESFCCGVGEMGC